MFERFTAEAKQIMAKAQEQAHSLKHNYIGTEHILLAMLTDPESSFAVFFKELGVGVDQVRARVVQIVGEVEDPVNGDLPLTPRLRKVLDLADRERTSMGHHKLGFEHILLGLAKENKGVAVHILGDFDVTADALSEKALLAAHKSI